LKVSHWKKKKTKNDDDLGTSEPTGFEPTLPPSSLIPHPSSLIPHPSSLIPHPSSLIPHPSSLIPHPSSVLKSQMSSVGQTNMTKAVCYESRISISIAYVAGASDVSRKIFIQCQHDHRNK
jgi:hypothetical protein